MSNLLPLVPDWTISPEWNAVCVSQGDCCLTIPNDTIEGFIAEIKKAQKISASLPRGAICSTSPMHVSTKEEPYVEKMKLWIVDIHAASYTQYEKFLIAAETPTLAIDYLKSNEDYSNHIDWDRGYQIDEVQPGQYRGTEVIIGVQIDG